MNPNFPYVGFAECIAVRFARKRWFCVVYLRIIENAPRKQAKVLQQQGRKTDDCHPVLWASSI
jgi:hypothetical protein